MSSESDFHRRRKAFVILDSGILIARDGFDGSHRDLLIQSGMDVSTAVSLIENCPRGYALDGKVYFYQGAGFDVLSAENAAKARVWLSFFETAGLLKRREDAFDGMNVGKIGENWMPVRRL